MTNENKMLADITARNAITDRIYSYCRAMDRIDHQLGYSVWHSDGLADYGSIFNGTGRGFIDWVCDMHGTMQAHSHQVANILIQLDGNCAGSEAYVTATLRYQQKGKLMQTTARGRYLDSWSCREDNWKIDKRIYLHDFDQTTEVLVAGETDPRASRNRNDPSYTLLSN